MQANPQSIAFALVPQGGLFYVVKSLLEIGSIVFMLYVTWELGLYFLACAVEKFWPQQESSLLDKIFGFGYDEEGKLHAGAVGSEEDLTGRIRFANHTEAILFNYGVDLRLQGFSRRQVRRILRQVGPLLKSEEFRAIIQDASNA